MAKVIVHDICCLSEDNSECDDCIKLKDIDLSQRCLVLCECRVLETAFTGELSVCQVHLKKVNTAWNQRSRRKQCGVEKLFNSHRGKSVPQAERHVNLEMYSRIIQQSGVFVAPGTAICRNCREQLLGRQLDEQQSNESTDVKVGHLNTQHSENENIDLKRCIKKRKIDDMCSQEDSQSSVTDVGLESSSQSSIERINKLDLLNQYLKSDSISPISKMTKKFDKSAVRTQRLYVRKAEKTVRSIINTISTSPEDSEPLLRHVQTRLNMPDLEETENLLIKIYKDSSDASWQVRRQILSIIATKMSFDQAQKCIPGLTKWRYYESRNHASALGAGALVKEMPIKRDRIDPDQLDHFIEFITSSHVLRDIPYGEKTMRLQSGEIVQIPNVVRSMTATSLISQYCQICEEETVTPLGKSTMYRILTECAASVRQCVEGLDNFVMEGSRAFQDLEDHLDKLNLRDLKDKLLESKRYLKTDFKVHLSADCTIQDHCLSYALSDPDSSSSYTSQCDHLHKDRCRSCCLLENTLKDIMVETETISWENRDAVMFMVEKSIQDIEQLQKHIVRSRNQERGRSAVVRELKDSDALVTVDWAMKFLPRRYREGQQDWFAKRGLNWHISVALVKNGDEMKTFTIVHIFKGQTAQDADNTTAVLCDTVQTLKKIVPIASVNFISDNAGCYKSSTTLATLRNDLPELISYSFSEAQNGKGPCDRKAANAKAAIKRHLNEGNDVTSAEDMKTALDKVSNGAYYVKVVDVINNLEVNKYKHSIPNISSLYNFLFEEEGLRVWQAYGIGQGKLIPWDVVRPSKGSIGLKIHQDFNPSPSITITKEITSKRQKWYCPKDGCVKEFSNHQSLEFHTLAESCERQLETMGDRAKHLYAEKIRMCIPKTAQTLSNADTTELKNDLQKGWALKLKKRKTVFNEKQKNYMIEQFNFGKGGGSKVDPYVAAREMRDNPIFTRADYLTGQQIASYFSRLAQQSRKADMLDYVAGEDEEYKASVKRQIIKVLHE